MPENRFEAVIFDMDGVMVDTEPIYFESNQVIFNRLGFSVSHNDYAQFVGLDAERMWRSLKTAHDLPHTIAELVKMEKDGMVSGLEAADLLPMPGLLTLIGKIRSKKQRLGLASSSSHRVIRTILNKIELTEVFKTIVSGEDVNHGKPAPDIFLRAAEMLGVQPSECLVIEDSAHGVSAAKTAGMRCVGFQNTNSGEQDLSGADWVVRTLDSVMEKL